MTGRKTLRLIVGALNRWVTVDDVIEVPPVRLKTVPGFDAAVPPYVRLARQLLAD